MVFLEIKKLCKQKFIKMVNKKVSILSSTYTVTKVAFDYEDNETFAEISYNNEFNYSSKLKITKFELDEDEKINSVTVEFEILTTRDSTEIKMEYVNPQQLEAA